jgi:hypothetical protein
MKRLCFLSPDVAHARNAIGALRDAGVPDRHLYVVGRPGIDIEGLPDAGPEGDDFLPAYERGLALGGVGGLLAGLLVIAFPPAGVVVGGGALMLITLFGAGVGGLLTGLAGAAFPSSRLEEFEQAVEDGGALVIMADIADDDIAKCQAAVRRIDSDIEVVGFEPPAPIVP